MKNNGFYLLRELQRTGRSIFTVADAQCLLKGSRPAVMAMINRLRQNGLIVTLTNGLYAILQPTEQTHGLQPLRVLDSLMRYLGTGYYVGLLSAANHWGAAHHKPQILQVITAQRHFLKRLKKLKMEFYLKKNFPKVGVLSAKTPFGYHQISTPELTALDVITYETRSGGFNNVCLVVRDLITSMQEKSLLVCCKNYDTLSSIQRLGYMMEAYRAPKKLYAPLKQWIRNQMRLPIPLYAKEKRKGHIHQDWKIIENVPLEFEE